MEAIKFIPTPQPKAKFADPSKLGFGKLFTDHMFTMKYDAEQGWHAPTIEPYAPFALDPSCMVIHYGQAIFEGLKAYPAPNGKIGLFRVRDNFERMNRSAARMRIPLIDVDFAVHALEELLKVDRDWIPQAKDTSLYIRPFIFATDAHLGVKASATYIFCIILSPVGPYYAAGLNPVKIYVEDEYVRAVRGGTGFTKASCNYAASLLAGEIAKDKGYSQVLWLDGVERKYIEEVGAMNIFFRFKDEIVTPALQGSILPGITRDSVLKMLKLKGYNAVERRISVQELCEAYDRGELLEVFGSGTAAVISPVGELRYEDHVMSINNGQIGEVSQMLYDELTGIQNSRIADPIGWMSYIE